MKNTLLSVAFVGTAIFLAHCSTTSEGSAGDTCSKYADAYLAYAKRCGTTTVTTDKNLGFAREEIAGSCNLVLAAPGVALTASDIDPCITALNSGACGNSKPDACNLDKPGTLATGAGCVSDGQCAGGDCKSNNTTDTPPTSAQAFCGKCAQEGKAGDACGNGSPGCGAKLSCELSSGSSTGKCVPILSVSIGADCTSSTRCADGYCKYAAGTTATGKCVALPLEGETCTGQCAPHLQCAFTEGAGKCKKLGQLGEACTVDSERSCDSGLICDANKCAARVVKQVGESCDVQKNECDGGKCRSGKCVAYARAGQPCGDTTGLCVEPSECISGKCVAPDPSLCK